MADLLEFSFYISPSQVESFPGFNDGHQEGPARCATRQEALHDTGESILGTGNHTVEEHSK